VIPLTLYLLTFILAFAKRTSILHSAALRMQAMVITLVTMSIVVPVMIVAMPWLSITLHLLGFFLTALVCHGELARARPSARRPFDFLSS
jgi:hypothetical protein